MVIMLMLKVLLRLLLLVLLLLMMMMLMNLMLLQLKLLLLLLLLVMMHGPDALSHLDASRGHGRQGEGHGGEDGGAQLLLLLLHAACLGDEYGLHAAHHGHRREAAHLAHAELGVVVALGGGRRNRLDGLGFVHAGRLRRRRG